VEAAVDIKAAEDADNVLPHDIPVPDDGGIEEATMAAAPVNEPIMSIDGTNEPAVIEAVKGAAETTAADMATTNATDEAACAPEIVASDGAQAKATDEKEDARVASSVTMDPAGDEESGANFKATDDLLVEKVIVEASVANEPPMSSGDTTDDPSVIKTEKNATKIAASDVVLANVTDEAKGDLVASSVKIDLRFLSICSSCFLFLSRSRSGGVLCLCFLSPVWGLWRSRLCIASS
jgi:hypothetical protein